MNTTSKLGRALIWSPSTRRFIYYYPLNTKSAIIVEVVVGQTKSINLNSSSQRALVHLLSAQCSALALAVFLAGFHLKLNSKQTGK